MANKLAIGHHTIELSNTDKLFYPESGLTKGDLIDYYRRIARVMLPYVKDRPLTLHRFPDGINGNGFYQQEAPEYFPDWIERITVKKEGGSTSHVACQNAATLVYLANQACITPHAWLSRKGHLDQPDLAVFDLDPPDDDFEPVRWAVLSLRKLLEGLGLAPRVKTTGSRGLHVVVPLNGSAGFDEVHGFAQEVARTLAEQEPEALTSEQRKDKRRGRVFLDYLRNSYGQTAVLPYAVRARPGAPVAAPVDWEGVTAPNFNSRSYNIKNIFRRLSQKKDPWQGMWRGATSLERAQQRLRDLREGK